MKTISINQNNPDYPANITKYFNNSAPENITAIGNPDLLTQDKLAIFCSNQCPGELILKTYDFLRKQKGLSGTFISGFHSSIEEECLRILLKDRQNVIICPARSVEGMQIRKEYYKPIEEGRLFLLSPFEKKHNRISAQRSEFRNHFVAAIADKILVPHAAPNSKTEKLCRELIEKGKTILTFDGKHNRNLIDFGARRLF
ncbi:DNA recombination-mediator protein A [bacterium BMS3Bbin09]|nr:DNA recombination-mediator protein A [bacterium BMS3Bbin09]